MSSTVRDTTVFVGFFIHIFSTVVFGTLASSAQLTELMHVPSALRSMGLGSQDGLESGWAELSPQQVLFLPCGTAY